MRVVDKDLWRKALSRPLRISSTLAERFGSAGIGCAVCAPPITARAARRLLTGDIAVPVDDFIFKGRALERAVYQLDPALCIQESVVSGDSSDSSIRPEGYWPPKVKGTASEKIVRELSRMAALPAKLLFSGGRIPFA